MNSVTSVLFQSIPGPSDNLIYSCRQGDQRAQLQIYKIYYKLIFNICLRFVPDHLKAEEIMHEVILSALEEVRNCPVTPVFSDLLSESLEMTLSAEFCQAGSAQANNEINRFKL